MDRMLNQYTYESLKKDIMTFVLKPGEPVSAAKLAERYKVSRTPAREALVRLQGEGLVDIYPQSKSVISKISVMRTRQEWFVRRTLELAMVDAFFENVSKEDIEEMKHYAGKLSDIGTKARTPETAYDYLLYDNYLHAVTYRVAGEKLAASIIEKSVAHYNRARVLSGMDNMIRDRIDADHSRLIELVETGNIEGYRSVLSIHLGYMLSDIEDMKRKQPEMFETEDEG